MQLSIDRAKVHIHRVLGNGELVGDLLLDHSLHEVAQHAFLAGGQWLDLFHRAVFGKAFEDHRRHRSAEGGRAVEDRADPVDDFRGCGAFEDVAAGSVADRAVDLFAVVGGGEHHHFHAGHRGADFREDFETVLPREAQVEKQQFRPVAGEAEFLVEFRRVAKRLGAFHVRFLIEQALELLGKNHVVFDNPDRMNSGCNGGLGHCFQ
jgi:hypothetical protein